MPREFENNFNAPSRQQIACVENLTDLREMLSDAQDRVISIETQLEWLDNGDTGLQQRRVDSLVYWKIAVKNFKQRINMVTAARKGTACASE